MIQTVPLTPHLWRGRDSGQGRYPDQCLGDERAHANTSRFRQRSEVWLRELRLRLFGEKQFGRVVLQQSGELEVEEVRVAFAESSKLFPRTRPRRDQPDESRRNGFVKAREFGFGHRFGSRSRVAGCN